MRIISKFRDYYDSVQSYGMDKSIIFLRKHYNEKAHLNDFKNEVDKSMGFRSMVGRDDIFWLQDAPWVEYEIKLETGYIGFCGKIYPVAIVAYEDRKHKYESFPETKQKAFYDAEDLHKFLKKINAKIVLEKYERLRPQLKRYFRNSFSKTTAENFFKSGGEKYLEIFLNHKTPIFYFRRYGDARMPYHTDSALGQDYILINPILREYGFFKIVDPYTAFQEISIFISGVLGIGTPQTSDISDEMMLFEKGFNEWSFKNPPGKKRGKSENKRKNKQRYVENNS